MAHTTNGKVYTIRKEAGKERKNCIYATSPADIPEFLKGAYELTENGVILYSAEGKAEERKFPVYISFELASEEAIKEQNLQSKYGAWPKDNGAVSTIRKDGKIYDLAPIYKAAFAVVTGPLPEICNGKDICRTDDGFYEVKTSWGETRRAKAGNAFIVEYEDGGLNLLQVTEPSFFEYFLCDEAGNIIAPLSETL